LEDNQCECPRRLIRQKPFNVRGTQNGEAQNDEYGETHKIMGM